MGKPGWLQGLMEETFFGKCGAHENSGKNEKNIFCLQCCVSFCTHCLPSHLSHPLLQKQSFFINTHHTCKLSMEDEAQADLERFIDCSYTQPYTINNAKEIFLNERPQTRPCYKVATNMRFTCDRILQHPFNFCSLACKANHYEFEGMDLSSILLGFDDSDLFAVYEFRGLISMDGDGNVITEDDHGLMTSLLEEEDSSAMHVEHGSSASMRVPNDVEHAKKQRNNEGLLPPTLQSIGNRRKGAPHRSPLA